MITEKNVMDYAIARRMVDKRVVTEGMIIGYSDAPMVCIINTNGDKVWWRADLCEIVPAPFGPYDNESPVSPNA